MLLVHGEVRLTGLQNFSCPSGIHGQDFQPTVVVSFAWHNSVSDHRLTHIGDPPSDRRPNTS